MLHTYTLFNERLDDIKHSKVLISTLNAYSYNIVHKDEEFKAALKNSDVLLPDGIGVVWATKILTGQKLKKIAGDDLFHYQMNRLNKIGGKCFFLGSTEITLQKILERAAIDYPNVLMRSYSPPFKSEFSEDDNKLMVEKVNTESPDVLFVGMTAPKQEKWAYQNFDKLNVKHICCIGAVFDFYAGTSKRAPKWMIAIGMEWFYRLISNPKRMWRRYLIGNTHFIIRILKERVSLAKNTSKKKQSFLI